MLHVFVSEAQGQGGYTIFLQAQREEHKLCFESRPELWVEQGSGDRHHMMFCSISCRTRPLLLWLRCAGLQPGRLWPWPLAGECCGAQSSSCALWSRDCDCLARDQRGPGAPWGGPPWEGNSFCTTKPPQAAVAEDRGVQTLQISHTMDKLWENIPPCINLAKTPIPSFSVKISNLSVQLSFFVRPQLGWHWVTQVRVLCTSQ